MLGKMMRMRRWIGVIVLISLMPFAFGGCFGRFPLTRRVYQFNEEVHESKWVQTLVMWAFYIIPVYGISMFVDAIVFNLVVFWGGEPLLEETAVVDEHGNTIAVTPTDNPDEIVLTVSREGRVLAEERFVRVSDSVIEVRSVDGELRGTVVKTDSGFALNDGDGLTLSYLDKASIPAMQN